MFQPGLVLIPFSPLADGIANQRLDAIFLPAQPTHLSAHLLHSLLVHL